MRKIAKMLGLVILIISIFSIAMAKNEYVEYLGSLSPTLQISMEGQRLIVQHVFTNDKPPYNTEYYNNGFTDYYHVNHGILKIEYSRYIRINGDFKRDGFGASNAGIVKKENDKLPENNVSNVFNVLGLFSHAFPGDIEYQVIITDKLSSKWYQVDNIKDIVIPDDKSFDIQVFMYDDPDYLQVMLTYSPETQKYIILGMDIAIYQ